MLHRVVLKLTLLISLVLGGIFTTLHMYRTELVTVACKKLLDADNVKIQEIQGFFPLTVNAKGLQIQKNNHLLLSADKFEFQINPLGFLVGTLELDYLKVKNFYLKKESDPSKQTAFDLEFPLHIHSRDTQIEGIFNDTPFIIAGSLGTRSSKAMIDIQNGKIKGMMESAGSLIKINLENYPLTIKADFRNIRNIPFQAVYDTVGIQGHLTTKNDKEQRAHYHGEAKIGDKGYASFSWKNSSLYVDALSYQMDQFQAQLEKPMEVHFGKETKIDKAVILINQEKLELSHISLGDTISGNLKLTTKDSNSLKHMHPDFQKHGVTGNFSVEGKLSGTMNAPFVDIKGTGRDIRADVLSTKSPMTIKMSLKGEPKSLSLQSSIDAGKELQINSTGTIQENKIDISHKIKTPLTFLKDLLPKGDHLHGMVAGDIKTIGNLNSPQISGRLQLSQGHYQNQAIGFHLRNFQGTLDIKQTDISLSIKGNDDFKGTLALTGNGNLDTQKGTLKASFQEFYLGQSDLFTAKANGDVHVDLQNKTVKGELLVDPVVVDIDQLTPTSTPKLFPVKGKNKNKESSQKNTSDGNAPAKQPFFFDILLKPKNFVIVRGFGIESSWLGNMKLYGHTPDFVGKFDLNKGTIDITGRILNFTRGQITFDHKIDEPYLDLEITKKIESYDVYVQLQGRPKASKFTFLSSPTLSQEEIIALIMLGRRSAAASLGQLFEVSSSLSSLSSQGQDDSVFTKFRRTLGIEALEIKKQPQSANSDSPQTLSIRKSITPDVAVIVEQGLSSGDDETKGSKASVEASITENLNLEVDATTNKGVAGGFNWVKRY